MYKVKNNTGSTQVYAGQQLANQQEYTPIFDELNRWASDSLVIQHASNLSLQVYDASNVLATNGATAVKLIMGTAPIDVVTANEKDNIDLKLASDEQPFVGNICKLSLKIPGNVGQIGARKIGGGYGFTDVFGWGDRVLDVDVFDKDYVYAGVLYPATPLEAGVPGADANTTWANVYPDGVELGTYVDHDLPAWNHGWRLWCDDGNQGGVDIDPLGGLAKLPGQAYLVVKIEKTPTSQATRACLNAWWGKPSL